ncbi:MAG: hypothetical protein OSA40_10305 [Phycisphaerales bacterium]|nr:hypothetical protein [Phycisphaerales bacterium]
MKYVVRSLDGREYGPFTSDQLQDLRAGQRLGPGDFIRRENGRTWSPFEKIAGLGDLSEAADLPRNDAPLAGPSALPDQDVFPATPDLEDVATPPADLQRDPLRTDAVDPMDERDVMDDSPVTITRSSTSEIELDIARASASADMLVQHGVLVNRLPGETDVFTLKQSFLDVARHSILAALLGRRGVLVCTSRRIAVVLPSVSSRTIRIAYPGRSRSIGLERRTSLVRLIFGVMLFLNAIVTFLGSSLLGGLAAVVDGAAGVGIAEASGALGWGIAALFAAGGAFLLVTSTAKALVIDAGDPVVFPCSRATAWHLGRIDDAHHMSLEATAGQSTIIAE